MSDYGFFDIEGEPSPFPGALTKAVAPFPLLWTPCAWGTDGGIGLGGGVFTSPLSTFMTAGVIATDPLYVRDADSPDYPFVVSTVIEETVLLVTPNSPAEYSFGSFKVGKKLALTIQSLADQISLIGLHAYTIKQGILWSNATVTMFTPSAGNAWYTIMS